MRKCKGGFIQNYLENTTNQESPELFHLWTAVSIIGAALGRKCLIPRGYFNCYPNQYIVLVSESARCRKSVAAGIGVKLYKKAELPYLLKGKITASALSRQLHDNYKEFEESASFIFSPELGKFLSSDSYVSGLMTAITDLYDCPEEDEYKTKTQGVDLLKNVFLQILGCTVPSWLATMPSDMVEGGFSSRTIFVVQNKPRPPIPRPKLPQDLEELLIHDLKEIHQIKGEFKLTPQAETYFDEWYIRDYNKIDQVDVRIKAYYGRKGEHVLKLAMALSASRTDTREISHVDIENSLMFLSQVESLMPQAFSGVSFSSATRHMDRIKTQIEGNGGKIEHAKLMKMNYINMDREELRRILDTLLEANIIRMEIAGRKRTYILL